MPQLKLAFTFAFSLLIMAVKAQKKLSLLSPDKTIVLSITVSDSITYNVFQDKKQLIDNSVVSFKTTADKTSSWKILRTEPSSSSELLIPVVSQKTSVITDTYNQLKIVFANGLSMV